MWEQGVVLKNEADVALVGHEVGDILFPNEDAAAIGTLEPGDHAKRRRLAAPGRAQQREQFPGLDRQADVLDRVHQPLHPVRELLRDVLDADADPTHSHLPENVPSAESRVPRDTGPGI